MDKIIDVKDLVLLINKIENKNPELAQEIKNNILYSHKLGFYYNGDRSNEILKSIKIVY